MNFIFNQHNVLLHLPQISMQISVSTCRKLEQSQYGDMETAIEESIRANAPGQAGGYYVELNRRDGSVARYPVQGAYRLNPFEPPSGTPFGTYMVYYVRYLTDPKAMTPTGGFVPSLRIQIPQTRKSATDQAIESFQKAADQMNKSAPDSDINEDDSEENIPSPTATDRRAELDFAIANTPAMITARADYEKQRMAMELAENNQDLLNKGNFSRDAAEALALNRAYRREAQVTIEAQSNLSRRTAEEVQTHWAAFRVAQEAQIDGMRMIKEQLEMFAKPAPPPPPPDYTPAIVEGLKMMRDLGVAIVQTKAGLPLAPPPPPAAPLPNQTTTAKVMADAPVQAAAEASTPLAAPAVAPATAVSSTPAPEVTGVLDPKKAQDEAARLWRTLAETSEVEALLAMMGPEQLQAFLSPMRERVKS